MAITPYRGKFHVEHYKNVTGSAFAVNDLVYIDSNGYVARFGATTDQSPLGLIQKTITSASDEYTTSAMVPVLIGDEDAEFLCDIGTGTGAQGEVGEWVDQDGTYPYTKITVDGNTYQTWFPTKFISTTQMVCKMSKNDPRPASIVD